MIREELKYYSSSSSSPCLFNKTQLEGEKSQTIIEVGLIVKSCKEAEWNKLQNMAVNDALPLLTWNLFGASGHQQPNFDCFIYIHCAVPPFSADIRTIYLTPFGEVWVPFADLRVRRRAMKNNAEFT